ncbi:PREDICTED: proton myo-inositol cotransporter-like [Amphimedon queenslandica]|uniref:Major facilitator superfamily (MFS) profile domain-containing protein n=1 Tax=Amphimedon queenslandica TaxID=400682 RepID=A0A1X7UYS6_AMPQE|nr:PREDICTED: proton myo-inositol cotransporter-like [Amphimedon queenslandica]|eukprot:XP_019851521.1 PREDICTED: proton myo-inositol cotransporter-like [Amphimedon queenslandica]
MADLSSEEGDKVVIGSSNTSLDTVGRVSIDFKVKTGNWKWRVRLFITMLTVFSATGGFLFGYDTGVVSGAMLKIDDTFSLTPIWHELIVASTIGAAAVAAASGGILCETLGRKPVLIIASLIFTAGAGVMGGSPDKYVLLGGRVIVGLGIGLAAMAVPMYIAESAPANMRGKLVVVNNLFITGGQFVATLVDGAFSSVDQGWRYMLGLAGVPSVIMFFGFLFLPESPRWLVFHGKTDKALAVLSKLRDPSQVHEELKSINDDFENHKRQKLGCLKLLRKFTTSRTVLLALFVGCGLQMFQQLGGINTVMYYSASIIQMAGFNDNQSIWLAVIPAFGNFIFTIIGLLLVDRMGRRKLLIASLVGIIFGFLLLTGSFLTSNLTSLEATPLSTADCTYTNCGECVGNSHCGFCAVYDNMSQFIDGTCSSGDKSGSDYIINGTTDSCSVYNMDEYDEYLIADNFTNTDWFYNSCPGSKYAWLSILSLFIYIMFFAPGMGPLPWTINSEIYPNWARSTCIAIATAVNWIFNLIVSLTFLSLADGLGQPKTFGLYAGLGLLGLLFVVLFVPETKGKTLEEVEPLFKRPYFLSLCYRDDRGVSPDTVRESEPLLNE